MPASNHEQEDKNSPKPLCWIGFAIVARECARKTKAAVVDVIDNSRRGSCPLRLAWPELPPTWRPQASAARDCRMAWTLSTTCGIPQRRSSLRFLSAIRHPFHRRMLSLLRLNVGPPEFSCPSGTSSQRCRGGGPRSSGVWYVIDTPSCKVKPLTMLPRLASEEEDGDDHFSDASEGRSQSRSLNASRAASPVPRTRVEKVDDEPRHGEVPGTTEYSKRGQDAVPDEVEVVPEGSRSRSSSRVERPVTPGGTPIPQTIVSKVDEAPSYGDVPGTPAYNQRKADAVPDIVVKMPGEPQTPSSLSRESSDQSVPETKLSRVDSLPKDPTSPMLRAHRRSPSDALPDFTETVEETPGKPDIY